MSGAWSMARLALAALLLSSTAIGTQGENEQEESRYEESIDVVGVTPIRGLGIPRDQVSASRRA